MPLAILQESRALPPLPAPPCAREAVVTQNRCGALTHQPRTTSHYTPITYGTIHMVFCHEVRLEVKEAMPHPINPAASTQNLSLCICYTQRSCACCASSLCGPALGLLLHYQKKPKPPHSEKLLNKRSVPLAKGKVSSAMLTI